MDSGHLRSSVYSLFPGAGDVAEAVNGEIELRAAADDRRADLLVVTVPFKLHSQHVRKGGPLWGGRRGRGVRNRLKFAGLYRHYCVCVLERTGPLKLWL